VYPLRRQQPLLVTSLCCAMALPGSYAWGADSATEGSVPAHDTSVAIIDIALQEGSELHGRVVDREGLPVTKSEVKVLRAGKTVAAVRTDGIGAFKAELARGGVYHVETEDGVAVLRVWQPNTAPPHAVSQVLMINGNKVHRGQRTPTQALFCHPYIVIAVAAMLVAVPVILHNNRDDRRPAS